MEQYLGALPDPFDYPRHAAGPPPDVNILFPKGSGEPLFFVDDQCIQPTDSIGDNTGCFRYVPVLYITPWEAAGDHDRDCD